MRTSAAAALLVLAASTACLPLTFPRYLPPTFPAMPDSTVSASLDRTLLPAVTDTVTVKTYEGGDTDSTAATEISYQLRETDQVWLGLSSLTVQRGDRYNGNTEETLRVYHYGGDAMRDAILECVRQQKSSAADDSSDFCRERAQSFLEQLRAVLG